MSSENTVMNDDPTAIMGANKETRQEAQAATKASGEQPPPTTPQSEAEPAQTEDDIFASLANDFLGIAEHGTASQPAGAPTPTPPAGETGMEPQTSSSETAESAAARESQDSPSPAAESEAPAQPPEQSEAPAAEPAAAEPAQPQMSAEEYQKQQREQYEKARSALAAQYASALGDVFTEDQKDVVADLMARSALNQHIQIMAQIQQAAPAFVQQQIGVQTTTQQMEQKFFGKWAGLNDPKYHDDIRMAAEYLQQKKPNASLDEMIQGIGAFVCTARGLNPLEMQKRPEASGNPPNPPTAAAAPQPSPAPLPARVEAGVSGTSVTEPGSSGPPADNSEAYFANLADAFEQLNR